VTVSVTVLHPKAPSTFSPGAPRPQQADHRVFGCSGGTLYRSYGRASSSRPRSRCPALNPSGWRRSGGSRTSASAHSQRPSWLVSSC